MDNEADYLHIKMLKIKGESMPDMIKKISKTLEIIVWKPTISDPNPM